MPLVIIFQANLAEPESTPVPTVEIPDPLEDSNIISVLPDVEHDTLILCKCPEI